MKFLNILLVRWKRKINDKNIIVDQIIVVASSLTLLTLSFHTITDTKIMGKIGFHCQLLLSEIGLTTDSSNST